MAFSKILTLSALVASLSLSEAAITRRVACPDGSTTTNEACCKWFPIRDYLQENVFNYECGQEARELLRLPFHDGVGYSPTKGGGGSDGSLITFADIEVLQPANDDGGLVDGIDLLLPVISKFNITPGDAIYFAAAVGTANCPGAPKLTFYEGRPVATEPAPDGSVNTGFDSADAIIERFAEVGFSPQELVVLLASHSLGAADAFANGEPLDSTPAVFDSQFFVETQLNQGFPGEAQIPSDLLLARDNRTACYWQGYVEDQDGMRKQFADAMTKLSLVAQDMSKLTDCSDVIPNPIAPPNIQPYFPGDFTVDDVQQACPGTPYPTLTQQTSITTATPVLSYNLPVPPTTSAAASTSASASVSASSSTAVSTSATSST